MNVKTTFYLQGRLWVEGATVEIDGHLVPELEALGLVEAAKPEQPAKPVANFATRTGKPAKVAVASK
ncbi:hypothetical protein [Hymenobacter sp. UYCo722]|uniref:hypothetical protein n=1 Tax=Hymenobacter sp. UYCo722 TaxID=3156335 RepID=UPI003398DF7C